MALNDYSSTFISALASIGQDLHDRNKRINVDDPALKALGDLPYQQKPQAPVTNPSAIPSQPQNLIPQGYYGNINKAESGGDPNARNPNSSATGPYQFTQGTWLDLAKNNPNLGLTPDGRTDPQQNEKAISAFTQQNAKSLYSQGIPVNPGTLYSAHFLGAGDAIKVLSADSEAPLAGILSPQVIKANPFLQGMSAGQFKEMAAKKGGDMRGGVQVASNDPNFAPSGNAQNPVDQAFASIPQQPQAAPLQAPQTVTNTVSTGAPPTPPVAQTQGLPDQFTPQVSQSVLPPREVLQQLLQSEATRPYAIKLIEAKMRGNEPGFRIIKDPATGTVLAVGPDGKPEVLIKPDPSQNKNQVVSAGGSLVGPDGKVLYKNTSTMLDSDTLDNMADQALSGDTSVFQNLGRGSQGAENIAALRQRMTEKMRTQGMTGDQVAMKNAEFFGTKAGERTLGSRAANIGLAANTANQFAPIAIDISNRVDRTEYPSLNSLMLAYERGTGDETVAQFAVANNSLINAYARAINPQGVPTDSDKAHAREILTTAYSKGQYAAAVKQMQVEIQAELKAPGNVQQELRAMHGGPNSQQVPTKDSLKQKYGLE